MCLVEADRRLLLNYILNTLFIFCAWKLTYTTYVFDYHNSCSLRLSESEICLFSANEFLISVFCKKNTF